MNYGARTMMARMQQVRPKYSKPTESEQLVARLREQADAWCPADHPGYQTLGKCLREAADRIEELERELEELRASRQGRIEDEMDRLLGQ